MASARCYTKSGSVEKYESNLYSMGSFGVSAIITGPDSNGNYTVTPPEGYEDSNTQTEFGCTTDYGGVKKTFYFKENASIIKILITVIGYRDYAGNLVFNCTASSDNSEIATSVLSNNTIILYYRVVTGSGLVGSYSVRVKYGDNPLSPGIKYVEDKTYYIDMAHQPYCSPSSGTYNGVNWEIECHTTT